MFTKKLCFLLISLLSLSPFVKGQELISGNLDILKGKTVRVILDFSNATIDKFDHETMCDLDENWKKSEREMSVNFIKIVADELSWHDLKVSNKAEMAFIFNVKKVDEDGEVYADAKIIDGEGNIMATINNFNSNGGRGKTIAKRAEKAIENIAKSVGKFFDKQRKISDKNKPNK